MLGRMGAATKALDLIIGKQQDVPAAIAFVQALFASAGNSHTRARTRARTSQLTRLLTYSPALLPRPLSCYRSFIRFCSGEHPLCC